MRIGPYIRLGALIVVGATVAAAIVPQHRSTMARVALFALAVTAAIALIDLARSRSPLAERSPFEPRRRRQPPPTVPIDLERLAVEVRAHDAVLARGETITPGGLRRTGRAIAASRLAASHGLHLDDPADAPACAAACGAELWAALDGRPSALDATGLAEALGRL